MDTLFGGVNHIEKGAEVLNVEDAYHTHGDLNRIEQVGGHEVVAADPKAVDSKV